MKWWSKLMAWMGFSDDDEEEEWVEEEQEQGVVPRFKPNNVVELQQTKNVKLVVLGPRKYEDVQSVADHLRARRPIVVNLEAADPDARMRILDFLSGAVYALGGRSQKVSEMIFLMAPTNIDISNLLEEDAAKLINQEKARKTGGV